MKWISGEGPGCAELMIIGEAPGQHEEEEERPFCGPSGHLLDGMLEAAGVSRSEVYVTNVVKIRPPDNELRRLKELGKSIEDFLPIMWQEIETINPNCILLLGNTALKYVTGEKGILNWRGSIMLTGKGLPKCVPTIHPAAMIERQGESEGASSWRQRALIQFDITRAVLQSKFRDIRRPERILFICRNSLDLHRFLDRYRDRTEVAVDVETFKTLPLCVGLAFTRYEAISVPLFDPMSGKNLTGIPMHDLVRIWQMIAELLRNPRIKKIGQNLKFDCRILENIGFEVHPIGSDTMLKFHCLYPELRKRLEVISSIFTEEPYYKSEGREFDHKKDKMDRLFLYNAKDAAVEKECDEEMDAEIDEFNLRDFYENKVMPLHGLYYRTEGRGIKIDKDQRAVLRKKYRTLDEANDEALANLIGHKINVNSWPQIRHLIFDELRCPIRKNVGEETLIALKVNVVKDERRKEILQRILDGRKLKKTNSTYLYAKEDSDGRMRTLYNVAGTETGRTSTQKLKPPVRTEVMGIAFQTLTKHSEVGADIRSMFIPDVGYIFLEPDLSQAESRVVALLANDERALRAFAEGRDIHRLTASWVFGIPPEEINEEQRFIGKTVRHAGERGMGKHRLSQMVNISEWKANKILEIFHNESPNIRNVFFRETVEALEKDNLVLWSPHGRRRQFFDKWGDKLFKEAYSFLAQAPVSDHLKFALLRIEARLPKLQILQESHDSFLCQVPANEIEHTARIIKEELEVPIDFSQCSLPRGKLSIPCAFKIGEKNWEKMENYVMGSGSLKSNGGERGT